MSSPTDTLTVNDIKMNRTEIGYFGIIKHKPQAQYTILLSSHISFSVQFNK